MMDTPVYAVSSHSIFHFDPDAISMAMTADDPKRGDPTLHAPPTPIIMIMVKDSKRKPLRRKDSLTTSSFPQCLCVNVMSSHCLFIFHNPSSLKSPNNAFSLSWAVSLCALPLPLPLPLSLSVSLCVRINPLI